MDLILVVFSHKDGTFEVHRAIRPKYYSVFIVREAPWPKRDGLLLW